MEPPLTSTPASSPAAASHRYPGHLLHSQHHLCHPLDIRYQISDMSSYINIVLLLTSLTSLPTYSNIEMENYWCVNIPPGGKILLFILVENRRSSILDCKLNWNTKHHVSRVFSPSTPIPVWSCNGMVVVVGGDVGVKSNLRSSCLI